MKEFLQAAYASRGGARPKDLEGEAYEILACVSCGFIFQKYVPGETFARELYGEWIDGETLFKNKFSKYPLAHFDSVAATVRSVMALSDHLPREIRFLDFGMGWGDYCAAAKGYGAEVTGVELAPEKVAYAQNRGIRVVPSVDGEVFDIVFSNQVVEHVTEPVSILRQFRQLLAPGGIVYVAVPNGTQLYERAKAGHLDDQSVGENRKLVAPLEHINVFSEATLEQAGREAGLKLRHFPKLPPWKQRTLPQVKGWAFERLGLVQPSSITAVFEVA